MDFEVVSDELYAAKREDFTALRDERAKQARPDRVLVDRIAGLRKPTVAAWLVNQVSRNNPEEIDQLAELGEALRLAHQQLAGEDLRALSRRRHELIEKLNKRAQWLARKAGYAFSDITGRQITDTFEAAVADEQALEALRAARLSASLTPGSPEQWLTAAILPAKPLPRKKSGPPQREVPRREPETAAQEQEAGEQQRRKAARARAEQEAKSAAKAQQEAEHALAEAEQRAEEASATVAELRAGLNDAVAAEREARAEVTEARKTVTAAKRSAKAAEKRATEAD